MLPDLKSVQQPVQRRLVDCRSDPIWTLSNGDKLVAVCGLDSSDQAVVGILYMLHVPQGVTIVSEVELGVLKEREFTQVVDDQAPGQYKLTVKAEINQEINVSVVGTVGGVYKSATAEADINDPVTLVLV